VEYRLLGPLELVSGDGRSLSIHGAKLKGLVVMLALEAGHIVSSERLIDALYGEPPLRVDNALQQLVSKLRRILAEGDAANRVATRSPGYCLDEPATAVDALRFEHLLGRSREARARGDLVEASRILTEALGLWRGEAFADAALEGEAAGIRARVAELRDTAVEDRVDLELELGRHAEAVAELEALVAAAPLRERRWAQLMLALYRTGRQSDALRAYQQARRTLGDELGVDPGPELRRLEAAVLVHDQSLASPTVVPRVEARTSAPPVPSGDGRGGDGRGGDGRDAGEPGRATRRAGHIRRAPMPCLGREVELRQLAELVEGPGLVTLVGPGGVGKTRLAVEVAEALDRRLAGGACWVELAPVAAGGVARAVTRAVGLDDAALAADGVDVVDSLGALLASRRAAIVLDNCEHLVQEVAPFVEELLDRAPDLWVLATSREGLSIPGEVLFPVPPLSLEAAVALFSERARAGGVTLSDDDLAPGTSAVADICRRLDRLPLALELAAARARHLGVREIARRIDQRFELLTGGPRTAVARQRTLRAVVDWSHALLDPAEQTLFALVSVFEGGFSLEAAEAVAAGNVSEPTIELLAGLVDKSIVVVVTSSGDGEPRYELLETLREYGREQLTARSLLEPARRAHRSYFAGLAADAEPALLTSAYRAWQRRIEQELANLRAAYDDALASGDGNGALRMANALWWFWGSTDRQRDGRRWVEDALRAAGSQVEPLVRVRALITLCYIAGQQLDLEQAVAAGEQAVALSAELRDELVTASAKQTLGLTLEQAGDHDRSAGLLAEARVVMDARDLHQRVLANDMVSAVRGLAVDDLELVDAASREVLRRCALIDYEPHRCWAHLVRARLEERRADLKAAGKECESAVASARLLELPHYVSFALTQLGRVALLDDDLERAETALGEALALAEAAGAGWFAALARVALADGRRRRGDAPGADALLRQVVEWSTGPVAGSGRVTFFRSLGGDPVAQAIAGLAASPAAGSANA
jgi:predicted ATPase/DNA-binding SARP family transcriptional activator